MWGPYNRNWRKLKDATRPARFYGGGKAAAEVGPITLHAKGRRSREDRGFDVAVGAYVATLVVACATGILARMGGQALRTVFLVATCATAAGGSLLILRSPRRAWGRVLAALPLILLAAVLALWALGVIRRYY